MILQAAIWGVYTHSEDVSALKIFLEQLQLELPLVNLKRMGKDEGRTYFWLLCIPHSY